MARKLTEDEVRDRARDILGIASSNEARCGVGQTTTFNELGFEGDYTRPDGWYLPFDHSMPALVLETKAEKVTDLENYIQDTIGYVNVVEKKYDRVIGILYNGNDVRVFKNEKEVECAPALQSKEFYFSFFSNNAIDKRRIYDLTKRINDCLHTEFGINNLYHRMIFTACALVAKRYGAILVKGMDYSELHCGILNSLNKELKEAKRHNEKLYLLAEVYTEIKMNLNTDSDDEAQQKRTNTLIANFIEWIEEISSCINSDAWHGEDVMGIFFNEFSRYKAKSEQGQVLTPEHITDFMYRILEVNKDDTVLDAACGSGGFLVKAMSNMIEECGGSSTNEAKKVKQQQLYGIEYHREMYALACANMLIHKDGKTNLAQLDARSEEAASWISSAGVWKTSGEKKVQSTCITKVMMNPPFEKKYGCTTIVTNTLNSVSAHTKCGFILPEKKLEKMGEKAKRALLEKHRLLKVIKLPEALFKGVTTSIFIFEAGVPQNGKDFFACYMKDDGLETVKNQGRHDIERKWPEIEKRWVQIVNRQQGDESCQWNNPAKCLSYVEPQPEFIVHESDFRKTVLDYHLFRRGINSKELSARIAEEVLYGESACLQAKEILSFWKRDSETEDAIVDVSEWASFSIKNLFETKTKKGVIRVPTGASVCREDLREGETPRISVKGTDNGITQYCSSENKNYRVFENFISVSFLGAVFYQPNKASLDMKVHCLKPRDIALNYYSGLFLVTIIRKTICNTSYADQVSAADLAELSIKLPATVDKKPDWDAMSNYAKTLQMPTFVESGII